MGNLWRNFKKKFGKGFTFLIVPNSAQGVKSFGIPFYLVLLILGIVVFNIYIFVGFTTQVFQIYHIQQELNQKDRSIAKLEKEQQDVKPTLARSYQIAVELNSLKTERERLMRTWQSVRQKGGQGFAPTSRGIILRLQPYPNLGSQDSDETALEKLNYNLTQLDSYIKTETSTQNQLMKELAAYERKLDQTPSIWPVSSFITSWFGIRLHPIKGFYKEHTGIDLQASYGTRVHAAADGVVNFSGYLGGYGYAVKIDHGYGLESLYGHNSRLLVHEGQVVKKGQVISLSGNSGTSTGPHLHFEIRMNGNPVNPTAYLRN